MHAAPARYVSVSELYSTDEVELLLEEIRELEPTSCRGEDVQDFEIAGSGFGVGGEGAGAGGGGGRSPAGTELTERSWDSHAHYSRAPPPRPRPLAPLYCRLSHLLTLTGAATLLIVLCCVGACGCVWAVCGRRSWLLPLAARVRVLALGALSGALLHAALLAMHVTRLAALLPLPWGRVALATAAWSAAALAAGAALTLHAVLAAPEYRWAPHHIAVLLITASGLGLGGACASLVIVVREARTCCREGACRGARGWLHGPPAPSATGARRSASGGSLRAGAGAGAYRAVPAAPPAPAVPALLAPQPSTSRDNPL